MITRRKVIGGVWPSAFFASALIRDSLASPNIIREAHLDPRYRVVTSSWIACETLIRLGVDPVGLARPMQYRVYISEPTISPHTIDIGFASQPNIELMLALHPDLVILEDRNVDVERKLKQIVPTVRMEQARNGRSFLKRAEDWSLFVGESIDKRSESVDLVAQIEEQFDALRHLLRSYDNRPLYLVQLYGPRSVVGFGPGGLFHDVLIRLGLRNAWARPIDGREQSNIVLEQLTDDREARLICFGIASPAVSKSLTRNSLWRALPFVRQGRVRFLPAVWPFGGLISAERFARMLTTALLEPDGLRG